jgi:hypothetical protein
LLQRGETSFSSAYWDSGMRENTFPRSCVNLKHFFQYFTSIQPSTQRLPPI